MTDSKPCSTPVPAKSNFNTLDGAPLSNPTEFRQVIGALQYLTLTRPDISFAVNHVAQFMSAPRSAHLVAVKRILRYLKGGHGLLFQRSLATSSSSRLVAFSDADWAGCPDSRRSTTGFCIFLGKNPISWCAKKQPTVSKSSAESEYRSVASTCAETLWILTAPEQRYFTPSPIGKAASAPLPLSVEWHPLLSICTVRNDKAKCIAPLRKASGIAPLSRSGVSRGVPSLH